MIKEATLVQPKQWGSSSFHGTTIILTPKQLIDYCEENDISYCNNNDGTGLSTSEKLSIVGTIAGKGKSIKE